MNAELESDAQLEIGHVLFMDVVGFSKLLVDQQTECSRRSFQRRGPAAFSQIKFAKKLA